MPKAKTVDIAIQCFSCDRKFDRTIRIPPGDLSERWIISVACPKCGERTMIPALDALHAWEVEHDLRNETRE